MRRSNFTLILLVIGFLTAGWSAKAAETSSPIVGTWQVVTASMLTLDTNETSHPFGEHLKGYIQYSPGGHMVVFLAAENIKQPASAVYTDAERVEIHKAILGAYSGTYRVQGDTVIHHVLASWWPHFIDHDQVRFFKIDGNMLTIRSAPQKFPGTGKDVVIIVTFDRVE